MSDLEPSREHPRVPGPSLWPVGLALGIVVILVGFAMAWWIVALGVVIFLVFGILWGRDIAREQGLDAETAEPEAVRPRTAPALPARPEPAGARGRRATRARSSSRRRRSAWAP